MAIANRESFKAEARWQRVCAHCGDPGPFNAHHVIYEQHLRDWFGLTGDAAFDTRNVLRICTEPVNNCHWRHHHAVSQIRTIELTNDNILYAVELMGDEKAYNYLTRRYDDSIADDRLALLL